MVTQEHLWEWFCSLSEVEQAAIAEWLVNEDPTLLLAFQETSDVLKDFGSVLRRHELIE